MRHAAPQAGGRTLSKRPLSPKHHQAHLSKHHQARPESAADLAQKANLLKWLLARLKTRGFHANKLYAAEILSVLLQQNESNQVPLHT